MAPVGHDASQALHSTHASAFTTAAFLLFSASTAAGQTSTHAPHPLQSFVFIEGGTSSLDFLF
jgi:hypothetical protein